MGNEPSRRVGDSYKASLKSLCLAGALDLEPSRTHTNSPWGEQVYQVGEDAARTSTEGLWPRHSRSASPNTAALLAPKKNSWGLERV